MLAERYMDGVPVIEVPAEILSLSVRFLDGIPIVCPVGVIDHYTAPRILALSRQFLADKHNYIVIDLQEVSYCDSSCIHVLETLLNDVRRRGGNLSLVIAAGYSLVRRVFEITKTIQNFDIRPTVEEARHLMIS